jgi:chaperonin cofactor prefoldin
MRDELDVVRAMRQAEIETCTNIQNEEFCKAYDAILKDKNALAIRAQTLELDNERLKLTFTELEHQLANAQPKPPAETTPKADREAELRRTIENYEEHHATLQRNCRRLEERSSELESKLQAVEKAWRVKLEAKDLEVVEVKARARQDLSEQVTVLRRENAALRLASSEATVKLENYQQTALFSQQLDALDWEGDLLRQLTAVRSSMEPLRQQMTELQETDHYQREEAVRERAGLQARVLEL